MPSIFSFGSVIWDKNYTIQKSSTEIMSADIFRVINEEIKLENKNLKTNIPEINPNSTKNVNDDRLHPVIERVAKRLKNKLDLNEGPGGSVYNAQQALKATLGSAASDIEMYHKEASHSSTAIFTINDRKIYGSARPIKDVELTSKEREKLHTADLITFPKSSINNYPSIVEDIIASRKPGSKIVMNVHSSNPIKNMDLYRQADAWIGTVDEMEAIDPAEVNKFLQKGGIVVETKGGDGLRIRSGTEFDKSYATIKVEPKGTKTGAGNAVEGVLFGYLLDKIGRHPETTMDTVAYLGCAAARTVIDKKESSLTEDDNSRILEHLMEITDGGRRLGLKEPIVPIVPIKRNPGPKI